MRLPTFADHLFGNTSILTLSAVAMLGTSLPAAAQSLISSGIYGGGTTLSSQAFRQIFDCYAGTTVANDGHSFSPSFTTAAPSPGLLPTTCTSVATPVEGLFAAVGSGNGQRGLISNDPHELFRGSPVSTPTRIYKPSKNPTFIDSSNSNFGTYPYPHIDFAASDAPLSNMGTNSLTTISFGQFTPTTNWQNTNLITAASRAVATYNTAAYGQPVQVPFLEVAVAIGVDVQNPSSGVTWNIQSAISPNTQAGAAIQLSTAQLCAIFSDTVSDWSDTATLIPYLDKNGVQQIQHFYDDNTNGTVTATAYTSGPLPIKVIYRLDDSGTSYILTNYLANVCPLLDPTGTYNYAKIFTGVGVSGATAANLPSSSFGTLIGNILAVKSAGHDHHDPYDFEDDSDRPIPHWISAVGAAHAALKIGTDASHAGRIGYLSPDFTQPYATTITETVADIDVSAAAPQSASIQDEYQREKGVYHPGQTGSFATPQNFVPPTPSTAQTAFGQLTVPTAAATYNDWNIYAQAYTAGQMLAGVAVGGLSKIALPNRQGAYPISGATFLQLYSCYADTTGTRVPSLTNWLAWYFGGSDAGLPSYSPSTSDASFPGYDPDVAGIIQNNGFHLLTGGWADEILRAYVKPSSAGGLTTAIAAYQSSGSQVDGCQDVVTGGAR